MRFWAIRRFKQNRRGQSHGAKLNGFDLGNAHEYRLHHSYSNIIIGSKSNAYQDLLNCAGSASFLLFSLIYSQQFSGPLLPWTGSAQHHYKKQNLLDQLFSYPELLVLGKQRNKQSNLPHVPLSQGVSSQKKTYAMLKSFSTARGVFFSPNDVGLCRGS